MRSRHSHRSQTGFTLLEVLLAVAILGMLMTAVYSTWSAALNSWRRGSDVSEAFQRERVVMDALMELTQSAIFFAPSASLYAFVATKNPGLGDSISFVTASDAYLPPSETISAGMRRVIISLEQDQYRRTYLAIVNEPALRPDDDKSLAPPQAHVISMDVSAFTSVTVTRGTGVGLTSGKRISSRRRPSSTPWRLASGTAGSPRRRHTGGGHSRGGVRRRRGDAHSRPDGCRRHRARPIMCRRPPSARRREEHHKRNEPTRSRESVASKTGEGWPSSLSCGWSWYCPC
jgi:prepilin-type N-terminal cleavage/methylation domain-containing protein